MDASEAIRELAEALASDECRIDPAGVLRAWADLVLGLASAGDRWAPAGWRAPAAAAPVATPTPRVRSEEPSVPLAGQASPPPTDAQVAAGTSKRWPRLASQARRRSR